MQEVQKRPFVKNTWLVSLNFEQVNQGTVSQPGPVPLPVLFPLFLFWAQKKEGFLEVQTVGRWAFLTLWGITGVCVGQ